MMNIIIIVIDCLRNDYASYLSQKLSSKEFIAYKHVYSSSPWTIPSITSILTGLYPSQHHVHESRHIKRPNVKVPEYIYNRMLQRMLGKQRYLTFLLSAGLTSSYLGFKGFHREHLASPILLHGVFFDVISLVKEKMNLTSHIRSIQNNQTATYSTTIQKILRTFSLDELLEYMSRIPRWRLDKGGHSLLKKARRILSKDALKRKFLFIHLVEPHEPYPTLTFGELSVWELINNVFRIVDKDVIKKLKAGYVEEVRYVSSEIHYFIEQLEDRGVLDDSLVIITSDHGQLLGEHNVILHGIYLYDELLKVPLIVHYPKSINFQVTKTKGVISTTNIYRLITYIIKKGIYSDEALYSSIVFAESWGLHHDVDSLMKTRKIDSSIASLLKRYKHSKTNNLECHRIRVIAPDFNYTYNADEQKIEYINGSIDEEVAQRIVQKFIKDSIKVHLKMRLGTLKSNIMNVKRI